MNQPFDILHAPADSLSQNKVLRNTYMLLAVSMIPTALGALLGVSMQFSFFTGSPFIGFIAFMAIAFGFMWGIEKNKNSGVGVAILLAFTFFMGLMLSRLLQFTLGFSNGGSMITLAAGGTTLVFLSMAAIASNTKRDFSNLGKFLQVGVILLLVAMVANIFLQLPALQLTIAVACIGIFSAYLVYDLNNIVRGGETNYISATLAVYLDIYNIFVSLLQLIMALTGERD